MPSASLLLQQTNLLKFMTGSAGIFGKGGEAATDPILAQFDQGRLRLEGKFSFEKRFSKIAGVLPLTIQCLGDVPEDWLAEFVDAYPPSSPTRYDNARQFCGYLLDRWSANPPNPPHVRDLAAYEIAYANVIAFDQSEPSARRSSQSTGLTSDDGVLVRRHPAAQIVTCDFDIRVIIEGAKVSELPARRPTAIVLTTARDDPAPAVLHPPADIVELLDSLDDWTHFDSRMWQKTPVLFENLAVLVDNNLVEMIG